MVERLFIIYFYQDICSKVSLRSYGNCLFLSSDSGHLIEINKNTLLMKNKLKFNTGKEEVSIPNSLKATTKAKRYITKY